MKTSDDDKSRTPVPLRFTKERTRAKAAEVWERLTKGPMFSDEADGRPIGAAEASAAYKRWVNSWLLEDIAHLVPEFREKLSALGYVKDEERPR